VKGNSVVCHFQRFSKFINQIVLLLLGLKLFGLYYKSKTRTDLNSRRTLTGVCFGMPIALAVVSAALDDDENFGQVREIFSCMPRLSSVELEIVIVWLPLFIGAAGTSLSAGLMLHYYIKVSFDATSKSVDKGKLSKLLCGPGGKLMFISVSNTVLAIITALCAILILPNLEAFDDEAKDWKICKTTESSCQIAGEVMDGLGLSEELQGQFHCGEDMRTCVDPSTRPNVAVMALFYLCTPVSFLLVALVFTSNGSSRKFISNLSKKTTRRLTSRKSADSSSIESSNKKSSKVSDLSSAKSQASSQISSQDY